jgi:predicted HicB family RNase H-like nuclease
MIAKSKDKENPIVKINVALSKELHKQIKRKAVDDEITINALILKALEKYLS